MLKKSYRTRSESRLLREEGYRLIKQIGEGSYAHVYLGEFTPLSGSPFRLACKIINVDEAPKRYCDKFLPRELQILTKIKHPYIIHVHSIFQRKHCYFIFMRLVREMLNKFRQSSSEAELLSEQGYKLTKKVGEGSYAHVYLGEFMREPGGGSFQIACKVINTQKAPDRYNRKFLPRELEILGKIKHPYIIHVYSIFQRKDSYFIFMRYAEHGDLFQYMKLNGAIKENHARIWTRQIALAVQYLHTLEIAHRDLKCENILITSHMNCKLTDFGFARIVTDDFGNHVTSQTFCGSKQYVAPEILRGERYNPKAADMWSLGVVIFVMLNKALPFEENDKHSLQNAQVQRKWKFRSRVVDVLSDEVKDLVTELLDPEPGKRPEVGNVVNSAWINMDSKLRRLVAVEVKALHSALEEAKSAGNKGQQNMENRRRTSTTFKKQSKDLVFWKEMTAKLELDVSLLNRLDDIALS